MANQDPREATRTHPPPALPDGSMPVYANHPLPGTPGGGPAWSQLSWGPEVGSRGDYQLRHGGPSPRLRAGLVVGLLVICCVAIAFGIVALAFH